MDDFADNLDAAITIVLPQVGPEEEHKTIWVDFDGTLACEPSSPDPFQQEPRQDVVQEICRLKEQCPDLNIIVFTARPWADVGNIKDWLTSHRVPFTTIVCGKPKPDACIDDLSVNPTAPGWQQHLDSLLSNYEPDIDDRLDEALCLNEAWLFERVVNAQFKADKPDELIRQNIIFDKNTKQGVVSLEFVSRQLNELDRYKGARWFSAEDFNSNFPGALWQIDQKVRQYTSGLKSVGVHDPDSDADVMINARGVKATFSGAWLDVKDYKIHALITLYFPTQAPAKGEKPLTPTSRVELIKYQKPAAVTA